MSVRVRVAPSPTGDPHLGTAYQALFNLAFARRHGGRFVLRIEDTDRQRSTPEAEQAILEALHWLGLAWDEGPDVGGPFAPYRQSERTEIYREHAALLLASGHAYRDFTSKQELDAARARARERGEFHGHDQTYRELDPAESGRRAAAGEPHTIRLRTPDDGECVMHDLLRGEIRREWALVDDQVLLKSDGFPTYHLANVVDDRLMEITHVIRGEEWINSLPKHLLLYQAFGWDPPAFCHLPLLRNDDANRSKLSKRKNPTSIRYYRDAGFLPQALVNFLALMGVSRAEGEEKMSLDELIAGFELEAISLGGPVFDPKKLRWLNGRYIREDLNAKALVAALRAWALDDARLERIAPLAQPRLETLADWGALTLPFFVDDVEPPVAELALEGMEPADLADLLQLAVWRLEALRPWTADALLAELRDLGERFGIKLRQLSRPFYVAISGSPSSTPLFQSMEILGLDLVRVRLRRAIEALGGVSGKRMKKLEARYAELYDGGAGGEE
ncbi:MAG TPA: glutamate--tRNA ligase [Thermoanaerobaculia bacterium]|nr:glutamate--tRNA ligase [Thermoanaerobaculia bacterium]